MQNFQKPMDSLICIKLPENFVWDELKWGWVRRVNIFLFVLGRSLYSPISVALSLRLGLFFVSFVFSC